MEITIDSLMDMLRREDQMERELQQKVSKTMSTYIHPEQISPPVATKSYVDEVMEKGTAESLKKHEELGRQVGTMLGDTIANEFKKLQRELNETFKETISLLCEVCRRKYISNKQNIMTFIKEHNEGCPANDWFIEASSETKEGQIE